MPFTPEKWSAFVQDIAIDTSKMTDKAARAALVRTAIVERDRVLTSRPFRPSYRQVVDDQEGAPLTAVRADGYIMFAWQYLSEVIDDTFAALVQRSPRDTGRYIDSLQIMVDGNVGSINDVTAATQEIHIVATAPYSRRLEVGNRPLYWRGGPAPGGPFVLQVAQHIVEETAITAQRLYGSIADIRFVYVDLPNPWIIKDVRGHRKARGHLVDYVRYPAILIKALSV